LTNRQRRELTHNILVAELISLLAHRFKPDVGMVKKRIEELLEREFLERVEQDGVAVEPMTYRYLA
jgi:cullin 3